MSLLFNILSRFVIVFLPRSKHLLISWLQSPSAMILKPRKIKSVTASTFTPSICQEVMGLDVMISVFLMLSYKLEHKESWALKNWCFWIVVLEKTLQTPLDSILNLDDMLSLDSILKSRDITLPTNVCLVKAMVFPVVMYRCETWTIKKIECWRTDALKLWCWKRLLRVPWTARRSNQLILNVINPEYSVELTETEALILWPPDVKSWLIGKDLDPGKV